MPTVLQLTDLHLLADPAGTLKHVCTRAEVERVFAFIRIGVAEGRWDFDQIVLTGDLTHDEPQETYDLLRELLGDWFPKCELLLGNHDDENIVRAAFPELAPSDLDFFVFTCQVGEWRLIGLDSHVPGEVSGAIGEQQLAWLADQLAQHLAQPTVLFLHHPPFAVGSAWVDALGLRDANALLALATSYPQIKAICAGHVHQECEQTIGGLQLLATPSAAIQFGVNSPEFSLDSLAPGFRIIHLDGETFRSEVVRLP
jgi:3',5'-cyclic-AMP phosphodiesterase